MRTTKRYYHLNKEIDPVFGLGVEWALDKRHIYLPCVLTGADNGHPCSRCESPAGFGRRWCYQLKQAVNADSCERIRRKTTAKAWDYFIGRWGRKRPKRQREEPPTNAQSQGQKRAGPIASNGKGEALVARAAEPNGNGKRLAVSPPNGDRTRRNLGILAGIGAP